MTDVIITGASPKGRPYPRTSMDDNNVLTCNVQGDNEVPSLLGMRTTDAAAGVFCSALEALGVHAKDKAQFVAAMYAEIEPRDGIEAMLVSQMTATHVAMTVASAKLSAATIYTVRESHERSMTRLSRTYLAQMDALKKYRSKAQQVVRVERVTIHDGGAGDCRQGKPLGEGYQQIALAV